MGLVELMVTTQAMGLRCSDGNSQPSLGTISTGILAAYCPMLPGRVTTAAYCTAVPGRVTQSLGLSKDMLIKGTATHQVAQDFFASKDERCLFSWNFSLGRTF